MIYSIEQQAILFWMYNHNPGESLNIVARAGCGKTFTILEMIKRIPKSRSTLICAYNAAIASEIQSKLQPLRLSHVEASTMHSAGLKLYRQRNCKFQVKSFKTFIILKEMMMTTQEISEEDYKNYKVAVNKLVSFAKQWGLNPYETDRDSLTNLIDRYGLLSDVRNGDTDQQKLNKLIELTRLTLLESAKREDILDFDDMIWFPIIFKIQPRNQYDYVFVDEAQDLNPARRHLAGTLLAPEGSMVVVGDPRQAIYGFTGADSESMDIMRDTYHSRELKLTQTFRCAQSIVANVQRLVPDIVAHKDNPEGEVVFTGENEIDLSNVTSSDVILCRNVAPLVKLAFRFLSGNQPFELECQDFGRMLLDFVEQFDSPKFASKLIERVDTWLAKEVDRLTKDEKTYLVELCEDRSRAIHIIVEYLQAQTKVALLTTQVISHIESLFGLDQQANRKRGKFASAASQKPAKRSAITLTTVHRSKGREWNTVYLWGANRYMPSPFAKKPHEIEQEENLIYVAETRAKMKLVHVSVD